jgi:hypothetical protein
MKERTFKLLPKTKQPPPKPMDEERNASPSLWVTLLLVWVLALVLSVALQQMSVLPSLKFTSYRL